MTSDRLEGWPGHLGRLGRRQWSAVVALWQRGTRGSRAPCSTRRPRVARRRRRPRWATHVGSARRAGHQDDRLDRRHRMTRVGRRPDRVVGRCASDGRRAAPRTGRIRRLPPRADRLAEPDNPGAATGPATRRRSTTRSGRPRQDDRNRHQLLDSETPRVTAMSAASRWVP
jgi:hypothetical protein